MNQVAEKKNGALATNLFEADANQGTQNIAQEDLALQPCRFFWTWICEQEHQLTKLLGWTVTLVGHTPALLPVSPHRTLTVTPLEVCEW